MNDSMNDQSQMIALRVPTKTGDMRTSQSLLYPGARTGVINVNTRSSHFSNFANQQHEKLTKRSIKPNAGHMAFNKSIQ